MSTDISFISERAAHLNLDSTNATLDESTVSIAAAADNSNNSESKSISRNPQHSALNRNPDGQQEVGDALEPNERLPRDAWADQGHFPLLLGEVSRQTIPIRGGARVLLSGMNFREGVQVLLECPLLDASVRTKTVTPKVHKSTEMEIVTPNLLDWWVLLSKAHPGKGMNLSLTLVCAGAKGDSDIDTTFEMTAVEESEVDLLYVILGLHRQLILASLGGDQDTESAHIARQRTLTLLDLDQPSNVTRAEHLALGVIYMLCDGNNQIAPAGMDIILGVSEEGQNMLHLAVILRLTTLVREISRHSLGWFQNLSMSVDSEVLSKDCNGLTALDFARITGFEEAEDVLTSISEAAMAFKASALQSQAQHAPVLPSRSSSQSKSVSGSSAHSSPIIPLAPHILERPLPPTPLTPSFNGPTSGTHEPPSFFPPMPSVDSALLNAHQHHAIPTEDITSIKADCPSAHRVPTAQAIIEQGTGPGAPHIVYGPSGFSSIPQPVQVQPYPLYSSEPYPSYSNDNYYYQQQNPHLQYPLPQQAYPPPGTTDHINIPIPHRANSVPIMGPAHSPGYPMPLPQGHYYPASAGHSQPSLIPPRHPATAPLPPPKHIVTRVNRPKRFTVSTEDRPQNTHSYPSPHPHCQ